MKFELHGINIGPYSSPEIMTEVAQVAEASGFDSVWTGEHIVLPEHEFSMPAETAFLDSLIALTYVAASTRTLKLATGVIILPQRNPLVLAKEIASLDSLSSGRVMAGFGVGYLQPEFQALGASFEDRGARTDEYLEAMLAIWSQEKPAYHGRFVSFKDVQAYPRPLQQPSPPIIIGGFSASALHRTLKYAHGWYGWGLDLEKTQQFISRFRQFGQEGERPARLGTLEMSVHLSIPVTPAIVEQLTGLGVHRIVLSLPMPADRKTALHFIERTCKTLLQQG
jgi:probable F420-dependent oxidoreductase